MAMKRLHRRLSGLDHSASYRRWRSRGEVDPIERWSWLMIAERERLEAAMVVLVDQGNGAAADQMAAGWLALAEQRRAAGWPVRWWSRPDVRRGPDGEPVAPPNGSEPWR
jgi:hypothetical protein